MRFRLLSPSRLWPLAFALIASGCGGANDATSGGSLMAGPADNSADNPAGTPAVALSVEEPRAPIVFADGAGHFTFSVDGGPGALYEIRSGGGDSDFVWLHYQDADYDVLIILCNDTGSDADSDKGDIVDSKVDSPVDSRVVSTGDEACPTPAPAGEAPHFGPINPLEGRRGPITVTVTRP